MDYFFHHREKEESDVESNSSMNSDEVRDDIESRLYSVIHHNDLTQPLPPEIEALFSVDQTKNGEVIVSLKNNTKEDCLKNSGNQTVPSSSTTGKNYTDDILNVENHHTEEREKTGIKNSDVSVKNNSEIVKTNMRNIQNYSQAMTKRVRYSDIIINEHQSVDLPENVVNGFVNDKESLTDWKNDSKLDFIPIVGKKENVESNFEAIFYQIAQIYPDICMVQLKNIILKTAKRCRKTKRLKVKDVIKKNKLFFKNSFHFKGKSKQKKMEDKEKKIEAVESNIASGNNNDIEIVEVPITDIKIFKVTRIEENINEAKKAEPVKVNIVNDKESDTEIVEISSESVKTSEVTKKVKNINCDKKTESLKDDIVNGNDSDTEIVEVPNTTVKISEVSKKVEKINPAKISKVMKDGNDSDVEIIDVPLKTEIRSDEEFIEQRLFDETVRPKIEKWRITRPTWKLKKIISMLRKSGHYFTKRTLLLRLKNTSHFLSENNVQFQNPFAEKLPVTDKPLITNVIHSGVTIGKKPGVPLITVDSSDEDFNNSEIVLKSVKKDSLCLGSIFDSGNSVIAPPPCPPKKWTKKMINFYDGESKRLRTFDHKKIKAQLRKSSSPSDWWLCNDDYTKQCKRKNDEWRVRCSNCSCLGHSAFTCKRPKSVKVCHMCGEEGHRVYSCPQKKCLSCGEPSSSYCSKCRKCANFHYLSLSCEICGSQNHPKDLCTDLWRCYHSTTSSGPIVNINQTPNIRKCCSYCAKSGHFSHECKMDNFGEKTNSEFVNSHNPLEKLTDFRDILLSPELYCKLQEPEGDKFLQNLSDKSNIRIDIMRAVHGHALRCFGTPEDWGQIRAEIMKWDLSTNNRKRKIKRKKKQREKFCCLSN